MPIALKTTIQVEHGPRPDAIPTPRPRLSWRSSVDAPNWWQQAAEVELTLAGKDPVTARIEGDASVLVPWPFPPLHPRDHGTVRVRVLGEAWGPWSEPAPLFATFLADGDWQAGLIALPAPTREAQPFLLRREFEVGPGLVRATWYGTAHGVAQAWFNGSPGDDQLLKPGWTPYQLRLQHETTDVTALLHPGRNVLRMAVAGGWYTERYGFQGQATVFYGDQPAVAGQLLLEYADGEHEWLCTDDSWQVSGSGPWTSSGIYRGEDFDARLVTDGWDRVDLDPTGWEQAHLLAPCPVPEPWLAPAVRVTRRIPVQQVLTSPSGALLLDFGQNLVGRLRIRVHGPAGTVVTLRHAEVLEHGELGTRPLRKASATDRYTLAGDGIEEWAPTFTFHGFRYARLDGWPGRFDPGEVTAEVIGSEMERTGWFSCSNDLVTRLHDNVVWSMRGNFLSIPTDCPQRDERLGWTGDIQIFAPTAAFLHDTGTFLTSWLRDLTLEQQRRGGSVAFTVPDVLDSGGVPTAAWGDVATVLPMTLYERYGDLDIVRTQYPSMTGWTDTVLALLGDNGLWEGSYQWGDWVDPDAPADDPARGKTDADLVASAHVFRSARLTARAARLLGHRSDAERYTHAAETVRRAWLDTYATPGGRIVSDAQTAYAVAIAFGLAEGELAARLGDRLAELVRRDGYRISTGFVGTPLICDALTATGHPSAAARMLLTTECPSWLYPVTMGATTIWERWDSMLPDGTINPGEMTSFNHYALGSVADWLHRVVAGLAPAAPGYRVVQVAPLPLPGLTWAKARHRGPYGPIAVEWRRDGDRIVVRAEIPPNSRAVVALPGRDPFEVGSGEHEWCCTLGEPPRHPAEVTLATSLAEIIDDPEAHATVLAAFDAVSPDVGADFRRRTRWVANQSLGACARLVSPAVLSVLTAHLAELNSTRQEELR